MAQTMTDAEFEAFMTRWERVLDADARGTTRLAKRYSPKSPEQQDHAADQETHKANDEWTRS